MIKTPLPSLSQSRSDFQRVMRALVALIGLLLVVIFVENISGELIHARTGNGVTFSGLRLNKPLEQCNVEHNGINYSIYPKSNLTDAEFSGSFKFCQFIIKPINLNHAGEWKMHIIWKSEENEFPITTPESAFTNYTIYVEQKFICAPKKKSTESSL
ncbi:hypothetical protein PV327_011308 [Microctonus hyperodae]|uniref:Uncharacterized protein n=1 Tax=Microctonus hyperodae TaxID=165561 RepID=A0AA39C3L9_MICHY|nr:hypothetical protein PV327_011308 [Microctonus hyperodae]